MPRAPFASKIRCFRVVPTHGALCSRCLPPLESIGLFVLHNFQGNNICNAPLEQDMCQKLGLIQRFFGS